MKYRLGVEGVERLMHLVGEAIVLWAQKERVGIIDSTPIEASRYSPLRISPFSHLLNLRLFVNAG